MAEVLGDRYSGSNIRIVALIESAKGMVNLAAIAQSSQRLDALMFGAEDYADDVGAIRSTLGLDDTLPAVNHLEGLFAVPI